jgi:hypothetical protein
MATSAMQVLANTTKGANRALIWIDFGRAVHQRLSIRQILF